MACHAAVALGAPPTVVIAAARTGPDQTEAGWSTAGTETEFRGRDEGAGAMSSVAP